MKIVMKAMAAIAGAHAVADRVAAERGADRELLQVAHARRQRPRLQDLGELVRLLGREAAGDAVVGASLLWMTGAEYTVPSSTIASWRPMLRWVALANLSVAVAFRAKLICGRLFSSTPTRALLRSRPVISASLFSR